MPMLAVSLADLVTWLVTCIAMGAVGVVVWKLLQRQEAADPGFRKKLDDDDARARRGGSGE